MLKGHKRGCRCVGCSAATRARGMKAVRKHAKPARRKNPDARTEPAAAAQMAAKVADFVRVARKLTLTPEQAKLVARLESGGAAVVSEVLADKGLRAKVARSSVGERALTLLEASAKRAGAFLRAVKHNPELRWYVYVHSEGAWTRAATFSFRHGMKNSGIARVLRELPGRSRRAAIWAGSWEMADRGLRAKFPNTKIRS